MNGDLRVAYRASPPGARDIVFVSNWLNTCELFPELPSVQGWVEAMTSLGRLIFFDQPGSGASDPVEPGAMPTLEQWADSITAVLDALGSPGAALVTWPGAFPTAALFAATHPSRTTALIVLQAQDPHSGRPNGAAVLAVERRSRPARCQGIRRYRDRGAELRDRETVDKVVDARASCAPRRNRIDRSDRNRRCHYGTRRFEPSRTGRSRACPHRAHNLPTVAGSSSDLP